MLSLLLATVIHLSAPEPSLKTVLTRVERYALAYEQALSSMVARERYVQSSSSDAAGAQSRTLVSDFLFLRLPGDDAPWLGLREVLEVDGRPIEDHAERLRDIVSASPDDVRDRALAMAQENARYNLGPVVRTLNVPLGVIAWMQPAVRGRFSFDREGEEVIEGVRVWRIAFREKGGPTIVRTPGGRSVQSRGRIWVDPTHGRVLQTELTNALDRLRVTITVTFTPNVQFGILVPRLMTEQYQEGSMRQETRADYTDYRRFGVTTTVR